jgi:hypothetical protein
MKYNLIAILKNGESKRIVASGNLQDEITSYFEDIASGFNRDKEPVSFDGRYNVSEDEIFVIDDFPIDDNITEAIQNPLTMDILSLNQDSKDVQAIYCGDWNNTEKTIYFQTFDTRKILAKKLTLINSGNTYTRLNDPGIIIDGKIDVLYKNGKLFFYSYHNARRILDLSSYYREATDQDLNTFSEVDMFDFEDKDWFIENSDSTIRKKIALLQRNEVLSNSSIKEIEKEAQRLSITISFTGTGSAKKLRFPKDKKQVKEIIRFLDEDYFISSLTKKKCLTNSKRYL